MIINVTLAILVALFVGAWFNEMRKNNKEYDKGYDMGYSDGKIFAYSDVKDDLENIQEILSRWEAESEDK